MLSCQRGSRQQPRIASEQDRMREQENGAERRAQKRPQHGIAVQAPRAR